MTLTKLKTIFISLLIFLSLFFPASSWAQSNEQKPPKEETIEAVITNLEEERIIENDKEHLNQILRLLVTEGSIKGNKIIIETGEIPRVNAPRYKVGDKVIVTATKDFQGKDIFFIQDYIRRDTLYLLFIIFLVVVVVIGTKKGIAALAGMAFSFLVIFTFILPQISQGRDPIMIAIIASVFIIPITFYLSHGFNKKTTAAIAGTFIALIITGILANFFVEAAKMTGFASEEAGYIEAEKNGLVNIKGLLLAGIIVSVLGILDDITVSQASVVYQLKKLSPSLKIMELYSKAMEVGRDHIASVVNTLVLVYAGASLPLFLLFIDSSRPFGHVINHELIAEEIIRTLVASTGLIIAVPITTLLTAYFLSKKPVKI